MNSVPTSLFKRTMRVHVTNHLKNKYVLVGEFGGSLPCSEVLTTKKWLHGDVLNEEGTGVVSRNLKSLVGIVDFLNKTNQGLTSRGVPLCLFYPLDERYPPFLVSSKTRPPNNVIAVVSFEHWNDKWPRGGIQKILGNVGDKEVEHAALLRTADVLTPSSSSLPELPTHPVIDDAKYTREAWDVVLHIDPAGCEDVDDVLAWRSFTDDRVRFAIGIADVAAWIPEGSALDELAALRGTSLYEDGVPVLPMLPPLLSTERASLRCDDVERPILALVYTLKDTKIVDWRFELHLVKVTHSYSYESVKAHASICDTITRILRVLTQMDPGTDSHKWVELAMLDYNARAALLLRERFAGILRRHSNAKQTRSVYEDLALQTGCDGLRMLGASAGEYVEGKCSESVAHEGLGLSVYCHASSPLRRYADLVNQRWLKALLFGYPLPATTTASAVTALTLNERSKITKRVERDLWFLKHLQTDSITESTGYCLEGRTDGGVEVWRVYVPAWRRIVRGTANACSLTPGRQVQLRVFCDLRRCTWKDRFVCALTPFRIDSSHVKDWDGSS